MGRLMTRLPVTCLPLVLPLVLLACGGDTAVRRSDRPTPLPAPATEELTLLHAPSADDLPNEIPTEPIEPEPRRIRLADLPEPFASESARQPPEVVDPPEDARLKVPPGFRVQLFADEIENARWLARTPDGRILCSQSRSNRITVLEDADGDGVAERRGSFADESNRLDLPFGMAFAGGHFYLGNQDEVRRYRWRDGSDRLVGAGERITRLPGGGYRQHWTRNVVVAPDGEHLFVTVGSRSDATPEPPPRASVLRMRLDGSDREVFATGLRNPVGFAFHPTTREPYATVNERDGLGDDLVPDYFTRIEEGAFYGWPYAYLSPDHPDPRFVTNGGSTRPDLVRRTTTPDVLFEAHSAALGLAFYDGDLFPERFRNGAFVAFRGSWNRSRGTGYEIVFVPFEEGRPAGTYEPFVTGFLIDPTGPVTWGRPVGVLTAPDKSLLFTDETGGRIYRISYAPR